MTAQPEWFKRLDDDRRVSARDVAELFGITNADALLARVGRGTFPQPDTTVPSSRRVVSGKKAWTKRVLLSHWELTYKE